jgi:hypothetical protein
MKEEFPMETTRELYRQKYEAQLHEWNAKIEALQAHADLLTAEAKLDAKPRLDALHAKFGAAKTKLDEIAQAADEGWEDVKKGAEHAWDEVKAAFEGGHDALTSKKEN